MFQGSRIKDQGSRINWSSWKGRKIWELNNHFTFRHSPRKRNPSASVSYIVDTSRSKNERNYLYSKTSLHVTRKQRKQKHFKTPVSIRNQVKHSDSQSNIGYVAAILRFKITHEGIIKYELPFQIIWSTKNAEPTYCRMTRNCSKLTKNVIKMWCKCSKKKLCIW